MHQPKPSSGDPYSKGDFIVHFFGLELCHKKKGWDRAWLERQFAEYVTEISSQYASSESEQLASCCSFTPRLVPNVPTMSQGEAEQKLEEWYASKKCPGLFFVCIGDLCKVAVWLAFYIW